MQTTLGLSERGHDYTNVCAHVSATEAGEDGTWKIPQTLS